MQALGVTSQLCPQQVARRSHPQASTSYRCACRSKHSPAATLVEVCTHQKRGLWTCRLFAGQSAASLLQRCVLQGVPLLASGLSGTCCCVSQRSSSLCVVCCLSLSHICPAPKCKTGCCNRHERCGCQRQVVTRAIADKAKEKAEAAGKEQVCSPLLAALLHCCVPYSFAVCMQLH